jgi:formate hydrogenlyase subunit 3/multisubunit Na+/H+ antiporter MnhD subunit
MSSQLLFAIVGGPILAALLAPIVRLIAGRSRSGFSTYCLLAHVVILGCAVLAVRAVVSRGALRAAVARLGPAGTFSLDRASGEEVLVAAVLFLALSAFGADLLGGARHGGAFLGLLFVEQAAVNLVLVADNLLGLYAGLVALSLSLMLLIGLDFAAPGGSAALRVFATLEVPAVVALAQIWVGDPRLATIALSNLGSEMHGAAPAALLVGVPVAVALASRAGLTPLQHWVVVGCRAAAAPVAVAIAAIALPVGGIVVARILESGAVDPSWLQVAGALGALTALVAAAGALRERTGLGWLAYAAVAQVGLAVVGFALGTPAGSEAGWLTLGSGAVAITLAGLAFARRVRPGAASGRLARAGNVEGWAARIAFGLGYASLVPLPPLASFAARRALVGALLADNSAVGRLALASVLVATFALAAAVWPVLVETVSLDVTPRTARVSLRSGWSVGGALTLLAGLTFLTGVVPRSWLVVLAASSPPVVDRFGDLAAALLVSLALGVAIGWRWLAVAGPRADLPRLRGSWAVVVALAQRARLGAALDPYLLVGGVLLGLGRLSALLLNNTLGRLVRAQ